MEERCQRRRKNRNMELGKGKRIKGEGDERRGEVDGDRLERERKGRKKEKREEGKAITLSVPSTFLQTCTQLNQPFRCTFPASSRLLSTGFYFMRQLYMDFIRISSRTVCHENPKFRAPFRAFVYSKLRRTTFLC